MSLDSRYWPGVSLLLHPFLIAWLSYWIIFLRTHLPTVSPDLRLGSGIRLLRTWFPLVSRETVVIRKASVWHCHIWWLSRLSTTDIIILSSSKVQFHLSLVMRFSPSQTHTLSVLLWAEGLSMFFSVCCCRSCSWSMPARLLHKKIRTKVAPSLPWTSATSWPPSDTTCWLHLLRRIWFQWVVEKVPHQLWKLFLEA